MALDGCALRWGRSPSRALNAAVIQAGDEFAMLVMVMVMGDDLPPAACGSASHRAS